MEYFLGSLKLMLIVYALAAVIAMLSAWVMKLIFAGIRRQRAPAVASGGAAAKAPAKPANATPREVP